MHKCACHNRSFRNIRGLNQHLLYVNKTITHQSNACQEIITGIETEGCDKPKAATSSKGESQQACKYLDLDQNEWISSTTVLHEDYEKVEIGECDIE